MFSLRWFRSEWYWVDEERKCNTCDGDGEIHSHNPRCYSCAGTGWGMMRASDMAVKEAYKSNGLVIIEDEVGWKSLERILELPDFTEKIELQ